MTTLVQAASTVRKGARASFGYVTAGGVALLDSLGAFTQPTALGSEHGLLFVAWGCVFAARAHTRLHADRATLDARYLDLELGCLALCATHAVLQMFGGLLSPLYPVLYVLVAFVGSFAERGQSRLIVLAAVAFEAPLYFLTEGHRDPKPYVLHAIFLALFGLINVIFTQAELTRVRLVTQRERADEKRRISEEARLFRLAAAPITPVGRESRLAAAPITRAVRDDESLWRGSVAELRSALYWNLLLLKRTLGLHSAVLLLPDQQDGQLRIVDAATDCDDMQSGPFAPGEGAIGACYQRGMVMNLEHLRPGYAGVGYYRSPAPVRAFVALPIHEHNQTIGVLCADRLDDRPFTEQDEAILSSSVEHLLRALENERLFVALERSKREQTVLYEASQALGAALTEQAVLDAALLAASQLVTHDFAAVTHYDNQTRDHSVRRAVGEGANKLANLSFRDNTSLTAMAVQNRHYLPVRGDFDPQTQTVFTRSENLKSMQSVLILPLCVRDAAIGTLALAARRREAFGRDVRPALQLLANQTAVALSNVASVARLEELATTDGLTGCYNKRYFHDELHQRLQASQRFGRKLSLLIADIDHFKAVNDTHGHHTGDVVIRELGQILKRLKRETDVVARFGGEEFCVLCEETGSEGAKQLAERVRLALGQTSFETEQGPMQVSCSLGVATFPDHAANKEALFAAADRALYAAKHAGRNQVRSA
jgi:two-component system cell cycle response regulator